jgi:hypothetical protein
MLAVRRREMKASKLLTTMALLALSVPGFVQVGFAQMGPGGPGGPGGPHGPRGEFGGPFGPGFGHGKLVTGAPYRATLSNQVVQHLADGNTVQRITTGEVARDSQGRTYETVTITGGPLGQTGTKILTFITDPVAGFVYSLDSATKTATQRPLPPSHERQEVAGESHRNRPNTVETELAADASSGVTATGKSVTHTIPAGAMGNAQAIVATTQTWYSSELQIFVKSVRNDPFFGQSTYALTNVVATEPDAALFKVPAGYTVKASTQSHGRRGLPPQD